MNSLPILAVTSHKGGTARTTTALVLARLWAEQGLKVGLHDADPSGLASALLAEGSIAGLVPLRSLTKADGLDLVVVDCPLLGHPGCRPALESASAVVMTSLPEVASLRALPLAASRLAEACHARSSMEFHGVLLCRTRSEPLQERLADELRRLDDELFLGEGVPEDEGIRFWAANPGEPLPEGPAAQAYRWLADELAVRAGLVAHN